MISYPVLTIPQHVGGVKKEFRGDTIADAHSNNSIILWHFPTPGQPWKVSSYSIPNDCVGYRLLWRCERIIGNINGTLSQRIAGTSHYPMREGYSSTPSDSVLCYCEERVVDCPSPNCRNSQLRLLGVGFDNRSRRSCKSLSLR